MNNSATRFVAKLMLWASVLLVVLAAAANAATDQRVALVIGNGNYREAPLRNPAKDARAMAAALKERGFTVILRENTTKAELERAISDFGEKLEGGMTGLFYYAGHGIQVGGRNFLIPVDARITAEQRVRLETVDIDLVLDQMTAAKSKVNLVILDACRNNPFERRFRAVGGGLAQINAPEGTLIAYSTSPGRVAADGDGDNGLYTEELLQAIRQPGLKVEDVFKTVRVAVSRRSDGGQTPWEASSLTGDFYFVPPVAPPPPPTLDAMLWSMIKDSTNHAEVQAFIDRFPSGEFTGQARTRLATLPKPTAPLSPEATFWGLIRNSNNYSEVQAFLDRFPNGEFAGQARARLAALPKPAAPPSPEATLWGLIRNSNNYSEVQAFLDRFPNGEFAGEARTRLAALPRPQPAVVDPSPMIEMNFWDTVKSSTNPAEYRAYIDKYPNGNFTPLAQAKLEALQSQRFAAVIPASAPTPIAPIPAPVATAAPATAPAPALPPPQPELSKQVAALPPASTAANRFDGRYMAELRTPRGPLDAVLDIVGNTMSGFTSITYGLPGSTPGLCRIRGKLDHDGVIQNLDIQCSNFGANFAGRSVVDPTTNQVSIDTTVTGIGWNTARVVWKKS